ncbi:hypothetical protein NC653_030549 [Populus alba x Populus x berolinensis]|uniref:Uncharacterized protein n=1 Tax=Populus alba x Populus x berolinensis TaxID=444605 RepID=A0AAD6Q0D4_9ROSI|nr:hypothetical protein NC653_030549 [Populus alba x Populus x berolinensis]
MKGVGPSSFIENLGSPAQMNDVRFTCTMSKRILCCLFLCTRDSLKVQSTKKLAAESYSKHFMRVNSDAFSWENHQERGKNRLLVRQGLGKSRFYRKNGNIHNLNEIETEAQELQLEASMFFFTNY